MSRTSVKSDRRAGGLSRFIPILSWLPNYQRSWLQADVIAGLTLWGLIVCTADCLLSGRLRTPVDGGHQNF